MPDFTIRNLMEIDDAAAGRGVGIEARMARSVLGSEHLGLSHFRYAPGVRAPYGHKHGVQEEVYVVVSGSGRFKLDDEILDVGPWDAIRVAPSVIRAFEAGPDGLDVIVAGSDRPEAGDGEIIPGWWDD
jgi:mannose-6-phosphate isomerase-like protein (cupin superfamily)